ncbi:MAG: hypothetical protein LQ346_008140 [Caloplaca aetnensis]|nr:MAG: hypothetical protein LQ346_008140 [Caloplaca aetnensis]
MYRHHRRGFRGHKHGGSKHTDGADAGASTSMQKPSPTAMDSGKHILLTTTADVASVHTSSSVDMLKATSSKMLESMPTVQSTSAADMHATSANDGKPLPTGIAKSIPTATPKVDKSTAQTHPDNRDALAQNAKPGSTSSQSVGQGFQKAIHKPAVWAALLGVFVVLLIATVMIVRAIKKRRTRKINGQKTRNMVQWHRDRGLV